MPYRVIRFASRHRPRSPQWSESDARDVLAACDDSGVSRHEFCARRGLTPSRLDYWRKRLATTVSEPSFVEFTPTPVPRSLQPTTPSRLMPSMATDAAEYRIEIVIGDLVLRVCEPVSVSRLALIAGELARTGDPC